MREAKELRLVYRDFLLDANSEYPELVALEADLSSSMSTNKLGGLWKKIYKCRYYGSRNDRSCCRIIHSWL